MTIRTDAEYVADGIRETVKRLNDLLDQAKGMGLTVYLQNQNGYGVRDLVVESIYRTEVL